MYEQFVVVLYSLIYQRDHHTGYKTMAKSEQSWQGNVKEEQTERKTIEKEKNLKTCFS